MASRSAKIIAAAHVATAGTVSADRQFWRTLFRHELGYRAVCDARGDHA